MSNQVSKPKPKVTEFVKGETYDFAFEVDEMEFVVEVMFTGNTKEDNTKGQFQRVGHSKTYTFRKAKALQMVASNFDNVVETW